MEKLKEVRMAVESGLSPGALLEHATMSAWEEMAGEAGFRVCGAVPTFSLKGQPMTFLMEMGV